MLIKARSAVMALAAALAFHAGSSAAAEAPAQPGMTSLSIDGVTVYDGVALTAYASQLAAQTEGVVTAESLARAIEQIYREDGHFLAEVSVSGDRRRLLVDEGTITELSIEGVDAATFRLIRAYFQPVLGKPAVTLPQVERALMLSDDIGEISVNTEIDYPDASSGARLRVIARPDKAQAGSITLDHPARQLGEAVSLSFDQEFHGAILPGDKLRVGAYFTDTFDNDDKVLLGSAAYRFPMGAAGTYGEAYVGTLEASRDATAGLAQTDVQGRTAILAVGHPVIRDVERYGYGIVEIRSSGTDVDVSGTTYQSDVTVGGLSWLYGKALSHGASLEYAVNLSFGTRTSEATGYDDGDKDFWHLRAGFGYETPLPSLMPDTTLKAEVWGQFTASRLPSVEEIHLGGQTEERGYIFAEAQGDTGLSASLEIGRDFYPESSLFYRLRPMAFFDLGHVSNNDPGQLELRDKTLASLGIGVDADLARNFFVRSHLGIPLVDGPSTDAGDPSVYVALTKSW